MDKDLSSRWSLVVNVLPIRYVYCVAGAQGFLEKVRSTGSSNERISWQKRMDYYKMCSHRRRASIGSQKLLQHGCNLGDLNCPHKFLLEITTKLRGPLIIRKFLI